MKLRKANHTDRLLLSGMIDHLKIARRAAMEAGCPNVAKKIKSALASADGAKRHLERRLANMPVVSASAPTTNGHTPTSGTIGA